jgi:hypothetical protein
MQRAWHEACDLGDLNVTNKKTKQNKTKQTTLLHR